VKVDVRLVCATNCDLERRVREGAFRQDFYHRINVVPVQVPTLSQRRSDIPELSVHLLERLACVHRRERLSLTEEAVTRLASYDWPGNVRELENVLARGMVLAKDGLITGDDLLLPEPEEGEAPPSDAPAPASPPAQDPVRIPDFGQGPISLRALVGQFERQVLVRALEHTRYDVQRSAQLLGVDKRTMHNKLNLYQVSRHRKRFDGSSGPR
jgi:two-component system response regulator PilR (NtrC family)